VDKEDVGTESNTEAQKGLASDSFKRAGVNWGIGRELYTAPFIWIKPPNCEIKNDGGKYRCNDKFEVAEIGYNDHREINRLVIVNAKTKAPVFEYGAGRKQSSKATTSTPKESPAPQAKPAEKPISGDSGMVPATEEQKAYIRQHASDEDYMEIMQEFGAELENLCETDARRVIKEIDQHNADQTPRCTRCGNVITGVALPDGSTMTASELIGKSKIAYGDIYCWPCLKALKKEAKKREAG
jgi:ribosomal protein L34E